MPQWQVIGISTVHALESIAPTCNTQKQHELEAQIEALDYHGMTYKAQNCKVSFQKKKNGAITSKEVHGFPCQRASLEPYRVKQARRGGDERGGTNTGLWLHFPLLPRGEKREGGTWHGMVWICWAHRIWSPGVHRFSIDEVGLVGLGDELGRTIAKQHGMCVA